MKKVLSVMMLGAMLTMTACGGGEAKGPQEKEVTVTGMHEGLKVKVKASADKIESVEVVENSETPDIAGPALTEIPKKIVEENNVNVDGVSGATMTSDGIKKAVEQAITEMGFDIAKFKK